MVENMISEIFKKHFEIFLKLVNRSNNFNSLI
jgi:hypothetical protein